MGTYCHLSIGGFRLFEGGGGVSECQTTVFTPSDRVAWKRTCRERLGYADGEEDEFATTAILDEVETAIVYRSSAWQCIERLSIRGFTLHKAGQAYESTRSAILSSFESDRANLAMEGLTLADCPIEYDLETFCYEGTEETYRSLDFRRWLSELRSFVKRRLESNQDDSSAEISNELASPTLKFEEYLQKCREEVEV